MDYVHINIKVSRNSSNKLGIIILSIFTIYMLCQFSRAWGSKEGYTQAINELRIEQGK